MSRHVTTAASPFGDVFNRSLERGLMATKPSSHSVSDSLEATVDLHIDAPPNRQALSTDTLLLLSPESVRIPDVPNRVAESFGSEAFEQLRASISASHGNIEPIGVRRIEGSSTTFELVFGERRLRACADVGVDVLAMIVVADTEVDAAIARLRENLGRADLAPYEFAQQVGTVLSRPGAPLHADLAFRLGVSASQISRANALFKLPTVIVGAFASPLDIRYEDVKKLADSWKAAKDKVSEVIEAMRNSTEPLDRDEVVKRIVAAAFGGAKKAEAALASCKSMEPQPLMSGEKPIGSWSVVDGGAVTLRIDAAMSDAQRLALMESVETFIGKKVLAKPKPSPKIDATTDAPPPINDAAGSLQEAA